MNGPTRPYLSLDTGTLYEELTPQATKTIINAAMREIGSMEGGITVSAEERQYLRDIYVWLMRASVAIEQEINTQTVEAEREVVQGFGFDVGEPR
jgi:hypothetical protein